MLDGLEVFEKYVKALRDKKELYNGQKLGHWLMRSHLR